MIFLTVLFVCRLLFVHKKRGDRSRPKKRGEFYIHSMGENRRYMRRTKNFSLNI